MEEYGWPPEEGVEGRASVQVGVIMSAKHVWVCGCGWVWMGAYPEWLSPTKGLQMAS